MANVSYTGYTKVASGWGDASQQKGSYNGPSGFNALGDWITVYSSLGAYVHYYYKITNITSTSCKVTIRLHGCCTGQGFYDNDACALNVKINDKSCTPSFDCGGDVGVGWKGLPVSTGGYEWAGVPITNKDLGFNSLSSHYNRGPNRYYDGDFVFDVTNMTSNDYTIKINLTDNGYTKHGVNINFSKVILYTFAVAKGNYIGSVMIDGSTVSSKVVQPDTSVTISCSPQSEGQGYKYAFSSWAWDSFNCSFNVLIFRT